MRKMCRRQGEAFQIVLLIIILRGVFISVVMCVKVGHMDFVAHTPPWRREAEGKLIGMGGGRGVGTVPSSIIEGGRLDLGEVSLELGLADFHLVTKLLEHGSR